MKYNSHIAKALLLGLVVAQTPLAVTHAASPAKPAKGWESAAGEETQTVFALTGDSIINRRLSTFRAPGVDDMFQLIRKADVAFTNFETLIHDFTLAGAQQSGGTYMGSPRFITDELAWAGFDLLGLANNHVNDFGVDGMRTTVAALAKTDFAYAGVGENLALARKPGYLDTPKGRVAIISTSSSFPAPIIAGPQRKDMPGRPGLNPLRHTVTYTVPQATYDTLSTLRGPGGSNMGEAAANTLTFGGAEHPSQQDGHRRVAGQRARCRPAGRLGRRQHPRARVSQSQGSLDAGRIRGRIRACHDRCGRRHGRGPRSAHPARHRGLQGQADLLFAREFHFRERSGRAAARRQLRQDRVDQRLAAQRLLHQAFQERHGGIPLAQVVYNNDRTLQGIRLHPVSMGFGQPRTRRGQPYPSPAAEAEQIFKDLEEVCAPFGTTVSYKNGVGTLSWKNESGKN
jgi:poly-gamma-glutamate synthesis protein (capsule biosynthesis protein)